MPTSMIAPSRAMSDRGVEVIQRATKTPVKANGMVTVSYTHLDVYKRQPQH